MRRVLLIGVPIVAALLLVALYAGRVADLSWTPFPLRLEHAVSRPDCARVSNQDDGFLDRASAPLRRLATHRFAAFCEDGGPDVAWYRFAGRARFERATQAYLNNVDPGRHVCISSPRREVIVGDDPRHFSSLCARREGRLVRGSRAR
ncbi:MAG TPA: hypothetical protein VGI54_06800 [Solirubrobacteraceae bacterium]